MGFDIYGTDPVKKTKMPELLKKDFWELTKEEEKDFSLLNEKYRKENPGIYFRNNVWAWRPLWSFVCEICDEVMSESEKHAGIYNAGKIIGKETALKMTEKLTKVIESKGHIKHEIIFNSEKLKLKKYKCEICKGKGVRDDNVVKGLCNRCNGSGIWENWGSYYLFSTKNFVRFVEFLKQSGGIIIN